MSAMEFWQRANEKANNSDFYGAERDYLASIEILDIGIARLGLAKAQFEIKKFNQAYENINIAINEDDNNPEHFFWRGNILWMLNSKEAACSNWNYAVKIGGDDWNVNLKLCN